MKSFVIHQALVEDLLYTLRIALDNANQPEDIEWFNGIIEELEELDEV